MSVSGTPRATLLAIECLVRTASELIEDALGIAHSDGLSTIEASLQLLSTAATDTLADLRHRLAALDAANDNSHG
jgi:hypothetical protein